MEFNKEPYEITESGPIFRTIIRDEKGTVIGYEEELDERRTDSVIVAISQGPKDKLVSTTEGLKSSDSGLLITDEYGNTTCEGVSAAGDVVRGAKTVVEAVAYARKVAMAMHEYMNR